MGVLAAVVVVEGWAGSKEEGVGWAGLARAPTERRRPRSIWERPRPVVVVGGVIGVAIGGGDGMSLLRLLLLALGDGGCGGGDRSRVA